MKARRCDVCGGLVHRNDCVEYGWFGQYGDGQVIVHRGPCALLVEREMLGRFPQAS